VSPTDPDARRADPEARRAGPGREHVGRSATSGRGGRRGRIALWVGGVAALVLAAVLAGPPPGEADLDPRSTAPGGLHGLLAIGEAMGGQVDISSNLPSDTSTRLLVARDELSSAQHEELAAFLSDGGVAVVADPTSSLHELQPAAAPLEDLVGARGRAPACSLEPLAEVEQVVHAAWQGYEVEDVETTCFPVGDDQAWLVLQPRGEGWLVSLGSAGPLVNAALDRADNAVLAATLLFPEPGASLRVLEAEPGAGQTALDELVPPRVVRGLALVLLASLVAVAAVARRLGRPVEERLPPTVPTAELTRSIGALLQRAGQREGAAARLRHRAREELGRRVGPDLPAEALVARAVSRLGLDHDDAARALLDRPVADDQELVAVAAAAARLHDRLRSPT
jgi:hypothetical protein